MKDDLAFLRLLDLYAPLLTPTQREIAALYFDYDLSLAEIAEQKGVSRQSVSDCLRTCRKQLQIYEQKLGFAKLIDRERQEANGYKQAVQGWIDGQQNGAFQAAAEHLSKALAKSE